MKKALLLMVSSSIILAACGNDDEQKNLEQEIKSLEKSTKDYQKDKKSLEKENEKLKESIKDKEEQLKKLEDEVKSNQSDTEESKSSKEDSSDKKKLQVLKVKRTQQKSHFLIQFERQQMEMLNSFIDLKDKHFQFEDSGMKVNIDHLQIFQVHNMPEGQVLLFNGAKNGYVVMYEVLTENTSNHKLYYDNTASIQDGSHKQRSDYASFIPDSHNEKYMKKSKENTDEYQPGEKTKSLKSIPISQKAYEALKNNRATFNIHGGVSKTATFDDATDKVKSFKLDL
ncbi:SA0632 family lipoprotein [Mammaliicoccus sciuri]